MNIEIGGQSERDCIASARWSDIRVKSERVRPREVSEFPRGRSVYRECRVPVRTKASARRQASRSRTTPVAEFDLAGQRHVRNLGPYRVKAEGTSRRTLLRRAGRSPSRGWQQTGSLPWSRTQDSAHPQTGNLRTECTCSTAIGHECPGAAGFSTAHLPAKIKTRTVEQGCSTSIRQLLVQSRP